MPNHITTEPTNSSLEASRGSLRIAYVSKNSVLPTTGSIVEHLKQAGIANSTNGLNLLLLPRNPLRLDFPTRVDFRVNHGSTPVCYLAVGRNLADLRSRTIAIAKACPDITCRPLFWRRVDGWDYFATEYFEGCRLDAEFLGGRISAAQAEKNLNYVVGQLEHTKRPSTTLALERELNRLFSQAADIPSFGAFDRIFLEKIIFPFIRSGALSARPQTRWTNGDLIPGNLLTSSSGQVRLVDYEFASRTHFPAVDAWRWARFSRLPPELRSSSALDGGAPLERWAEAICILQQLILLHKLHPAAVALEDGRLLARELMDLTALAHSDFRGEVLVKSLAVRATQTPTNPTTRHPKAQLFWATSGNYDETRSLSLGHSADGSGLFRFEIHDAPEHLKLRLDPTDCTGLLEISAIRVRHQPSNRTLLSLSESTGWDSLRLVNDILRLPDSPFLNILSLGDDPVLELPDIKNASTGGLVTVEVWMRFSADLRGLRLMLPSFLQPIGDSHRPQPERSESQRCDAHPDASFQIVDPISDLSPDQPGNTPTHASSNVEHQKLEAAYATALAEIERLTTEAQHASERVRTLESEQRSLRDQLEADSAALTHKNAQSAAEAARAVEKIGTLESELLDLRQQLELRTSAETTVTTELRSLIEVHAKLASAHDITKSEAERVAIELTQTTHRIATLEAELHRTKRQNEQALTAEATMKESLRQTSDQLMRLQTELAESRARETAQAKIAQEAVAEAKREEHIRDQQLRDAMGECQAAQNEASTALARLELLSKRTAALESQHAAASLRAEVTIAHLEQSRRESAELTAALTLEHERLASAKQYIQSQEEKIKRLEKDLSKQKAECVEFQRTMDAMSSSQFAQLDQLRGALETAEKDRQYYAGRCERMTQSISWRSTVPLRWLRRKLIDPRQG